MKTIKFFAAAAAVVACVSCNQEPTKYEALVNEIKGDKDLKKLEVSEEKMSEASYLLGVNAGLMMQGGLFDELKEVDMDKFNKGFEDAFAAGQPSNPYMMDSAWAKKFEVSPYEMNKILNEYAEARMAYKAMFNEKLGKKFLADNKKNKGVVETESGLQYIIHKAGEGDNVTLQDNVVVKYKGTLIDGTEFDANDSLNRPVAGFIPGWKEGLCLLSKGAKATLYVPGNIAYGEMAPPAIGPNSTLIFEVEILDIIKPVVEEAATEEGAEVEAVEVAL